MQTIVRSDRNILVNAALTRRVENLLHTALRHFGRRPTRVEVHLSDENGAHKSTDDDVRCVINAKLAGLPQVAVEHKEGSVFRSVRGAIDKLDRKLKRLIGRRRDPKRRRATADV
jgi:ribosomal subunit interface protein